MNTANTWVIVVTVNEGEDGEKVMLRRISFGCPDSAFSSTADDTSVETYTSQGEASVDYYPEASVV